MYIKYWIDDKAFDGSDCRTWRVVPIASSQSVEWSYQMVDKLDTFDYIGHVENVPHVNAKTPADRYGLVVRYDIDTDTPRQLFSQGDVYLLNDAGKTIEVL